MLAGVRSSKGAQLAVGLAISVCFGFCLQKGAVTRYDVIIGQLLLRDFTVVKVMLSAVVTGMLAVHLLRALRLVELHPKPGSLGSSALGGLIFGVGFALLGYCPGTVAGAVGSGHLDALFGGVTGIMLGSGFFAAAYPTLDRSVLSKGYFGELTFPQALKLNPWVLVLPAAAVLAALLAMIEHAGL